MSRNADLLIGTMIFPNWQQADQEIGVPLHEDDFGSGTGVSPVSFW